MKVEVGEGLKGTAIGDETITVGFQGQRTHKFLDDRHQIGQKNGVMWVQGEQRAKRSFGDDDDVDDMTRSRMVKRK